jgi:hypothetical protein
MFEILNMNPLLMKKRKLGLLIIFTLIFKPVIVYPQGPGHVSYVAGQNGIGYFPLLEKGAAAPVLLGKDEWPGVTRAANNLRNDVSSVTGTMPSMLTQLNGEHDVVLVGTLGRNEWIDRLVRERKIQVTDIAGKWETYLIQTVQNPFPGVDKALVIAGSDKRGTIYGIYDLSAQLGVSPWYWWADVPVQKKKEVYIKSGRYTDGEPAVKYRGIFINDEAPAFSRWAKAKFGGVNHLVYEKMFELILRLKGNYLWPAMWSNAFNDDDKLDPVLANEYGIVMGTSHHEPMDRAQQEWKRYGHGEWNYTSNKPELQDFWRKGIENMGSKETIVTIGMRGDGDKPMTEGSNIALLENIVKDQREIIRNVLKKDPAEVPQVWALYKEVQDYYDKGMRVPDDVTLLLCDDNWGNIRKLPSLTEKNRKGGYGIYYHFDYVGGPRSYKWINTNPISKVWEQMHLAYAYNAKQLWVVNVGDLKPMEYPISFFLDYAWNPNRWTADNLTEYAVQWASQQFGSANAAEIAGILTLYSHYNSRRKPELLDQHSYSLTNYNEFYRIVRDYNMLKDKAEKLYWTISPEYRDAFYQLVLHPVKACANLNEMYFETAKNNYYSKKGNAAEANASAAKVKMLFNRDKELSAYYNKSLADGKWDHMMDQTHISYTSWSDPRVDEMPVVVELNPDSVKSHIGLPLTDESQPIDQRGKGLNDENGYIAIEAEHYIRAVANDKVKWTTIPEYGNTLSGVTPWPVTANRAHPGSNSSARLEYDINLKKAGTIAVTTFVSPTLDFRNQDGLFYAISVDDEKPQMVNIATKVDGKDWAMAVRDNVRKLVTRHEVSKPGKHTLKYWMVDPAVVVQKIIIDSGGLKSSYLGPME